MSLLIFSFLTVIMGSQLGRGEMEEKRGKKEKAQILLVSGLLVLWGKRPEPCEKIKEEVEP